MNDNISRIALVLVALVASAFLVKDCGKADGDESATTVADSSGAADTGTSPDDPEFDPTEGEEKVKPFPVATADKPEAPEPLERREVGPPLADGTVVDLGFRYKKGAVSRYRIENASTQRNRDNDLTVFTRRWDDVTTKVVSVGDDGSARVRLTIDAVRLQAYYPNGLILEFDSRNPDDSLLDDPNAALVIKPMLSLIGMPVELDLTINGAPVKIEGLDGWRDAWEEAVERVSPGDSRELSTPFSSDTVLFEWREMLFPPVIGEPLAVGDGRDMELLRDTMQKAYVKFAGPMQATHDDGDVFRVRMNATPGMVVRQGEARSPQEAAIAQTHVAASKDAYYAAWRFSRDEGRLVDAEIEADYQLWVSWPVGKDAVGADAYQPVFLQIQRQTRVELLPE
jgi:hypothetical protein